ncbi:S1/P1 nuclease [Reinekea blandensis]|uniref:S1/P1 nuclease n=1 Tax=Reinekea blandensis TaxID=374838 RepID=UPI001F396783|nr:S1/P1 nuclease [Reinekea blandensis]
MARSCGGLGLRSGGHVGRKTKPSRLSLLLALTLCSGVALAFEESGHTMVAQLMVPFLKDGARSELERLYGEDWSREIVSRAAMVQADLNRPQNKSMIPLQLTLFEQGDETFQPDKHCPNNRCSVGAVLESREVLLRSSFSDADKRQATIYLMHYALQMHIPVNSGLKRDDGGRKIYLKDDDLQPVNLAWIWNHDLYRQMDKRWFTYAQELYRDIEKVDPQAWVESMNPADWALEAHEIAEAEVYPLAAEGRYSAQLKRAGTAVLEEQLKKAAYRTASLFNEMFPPEDAPDMAESEAEG